MNYRTFVFDSPNFTDAGWGWQEPQRPVVAQPWISTDMHQLLQWQQMQRDLCVSVIAPLRQDYIEDFVDPNSLDMVAPLEEHTVLFQWEKDEEGWPNFDVDEADLELFEI